MKEFLARTVRPARPLRRNIQCVAFMASAALVTAMMAQGVRVRLNVLDTWHYVAPLEDLGTSRLHELLQDSRFKYIAVVTFLVSPTGSNQTWTAPGNWNSGNNKVETIGAGGSGGAISVSDPVGATVVGGAGGAYSKVTNLAFAPGSGAATYQIGTGGAAIAAAFETTGTGNAGGDSWFNGSTLGASSVGAKGGAAGVGEGTISTSGAAGGAAASGVGSTKNSGGGSGNAATSGDPVGVTGGGGAAGPNGNGNASSAVNAAGGTTGSAGGSADAGSGGAGGAASIDTASNAGNGGAGTEFDGSHGSGGGGGALANDGGSTLHGGTGGLYGGGGGGQAQGSAAGIGTSTSGAGAQGLIVVTNVPATRAIFVGLVG